MASRLLTRSKALALAVSRFDAAAPAPLAVARGIRTLSTLPRDPAATPAPSPRQPAVVSPLGLSKVDFPHPLSMSLVSYVESLAVDVTVMGLSV